MSVPDLVLDPSLRTWVLIPIMVVMILVGIIRHLATVLLSPATNSKNVDNKTQREQHFLTYAIALRNNGVNLPPAAFHSTQAALSENLRSAKYVKDPNKKAAMDMFNDPKNMENMTSGLKSQIMMFVPQTVMMGWINAFFAGFVVMKLPFPLTLRFKSMLQSGVATQDLDVRWVSSLSWYILLLLGLRSVYALILGGSNQAGGMAAMGPVNPQAGFTQPGVDYAKLHVAEAENLDLVKHEYLLKGIEDRIIKKYE